jgi:hypothetical protein
LDQASSLLCCQVQCGCEAFERRSGCDQAWADVDGTAGCVPGKGEVTKVTYRTRPKVVGTAGWRVAEANGGRSFAEELGRVGLGWVGWERASEGIEWWLSRYIT